MAEDQLTAAAKGINGAASRRDEPEERLCFCLVIMGK